MICDAGRIFNESAEAMRANTVIINKGGTRSGKTWSILQLCYAIILTRRNLLVSVVGETMPFLKRGAMRDFKTMLGDQWRDEWYNATDKVYTIPSTRSAIEFFSADNDGKVHGSARDILFVNECYFISYDIYRQLAVRTRRLVFLDYNPRSRFWVDDNLIGREGVALIHSTYKDNPHLTPMQIGQIESNKGDANWWRVYGLGETGTVEGLIYTRWDIVDAFPPEVKRYAVGIDFGYNDPTAIVKVALQGGSLWVDEVAFRSGMDNADISEALRRAGFNYLTPIVADSAEPKSIAEINAFGFNVVPSVKGADSVKNGIQVVSRYPLHVTSTSTNVIKELRNYQWRRDMNGNNLGVPEHAFSHSMDALRYCASTYFSARPKQAKPTATWIPTYRNE